MSRSQENYELKPTIVEDLVSWKSKWPRRTAADAFLLRREPVL